MTQHPDIAQFVDNDRPSGLGDIREFVDCCECHAWYFDEGLISLHTAVDNLQSLAERWGMVDKVGQDLIQAEIAGPLAIVRGMAPRLPSDYALQLVQQWELDDPRDRWRWTGDQRPDPQPAQSVSKVHRVPASAVAAFQFVVRTGDARKLKTWLHNHADDAPTLLKLLEAQR